VGWGVGELQGISIEKNLNRYHIYHSRTREERIYSSSILVIIVTSLLEIGENVTQLNTSSRTFAVFPLGFDGFRNPHPPLCHIPPETKGWGCFHLTVRRETTNCDDEKDRLREDQLREDQLRVFGSPAPISRRPFDLSPRWLESRVGNTGFGFQALDNHRTLKRAVRSVTCV
jgi:hypothetical protein